MLLYSVSATWMVLQVFCSSSCNLYCEGEQKPAAPCLCCNELLQAVGVSHNLTSFLTSHTSLELSLKHFLGTGKKTPARRCFVRSLHHLQTPTPPMNKRQSSKLRSKPAADSARMHSAQLEGLLQHGRPAWRATAGIVTVCSRNACDGEVCSDSSQQCQYFSPTCAAAQANHPSH